MALKDYFTDVDIIEKEETSDDLGGYTTRYVLKATIKGLLQRASTSERTIAAQLGVSDVYTFMSDDDNLAGITIDTNTIVREETKVGLISSSMLKGQGDLEDVKQWTANSYKMPDDAIIVEGE